MPDELDKILNDHLEMCLEDGVENLSKDHYVQLKYRLNALFLSQALDLMPKDYTPDGHDPNACMNHTKYTAACVACQRQMTRQHTLTELRAAFQAKYGGSELKGKPDNE